MWDGGVEFAVHGSGRSRYTADLTIPKAYLPSPTAVPSVTVDVVCDGFDTKARTPQELVGIRFPR